MLSWLRGIRHDKRVQPSYRRAAAKDVVSSTTSIIAAQASPEQLQSFLCACGGRRVERYSLEMAVVVPDDVMQAAGLSEAEARLALALELFRQERLTLGQASRVAGIPQAEMLAELGRHEIPIHYGVDELNEDLRTIQKLFPDDSRR
jgi:predicted HTH domain antitoxin